MLPSVIEENRNALERFKAMVGKTFREAYQQDSIIAIYNLRTVCGYRCAGCGGFHITGPAIAYCGYNEYGLCYGCQANNKKSEVRFKIED